jgi:hypothetical protein
MKALLSKLFGTGVTKTHTTAVDPNEPFVINIYDDRVVVHRPDGQREELAWDALEKVVVRVSDRAPWAGTPWLILAGDAASQQGCVVPMTAANHEALVRACRSCPASISRNSTTRCATPPRQVTHRRESVEAIRSRSPSAQDEEASHDAASQR